MKLLGLATSAALFYLYKNRQHSASEKSLENIQMETLTPDEYGVNINYTPMPDNLYFMTTMRVVSIGKDSCKVKIYLYLKSTDRKEPIYIESIQVNGSLFGKYFYFSGKPTKQDDCDYTAYSIQYTRAISVRYSTYNHMFGVGECKGLTPEEIEQIREAVKENSKEKRDFANVDLLVRWSRNDDGRTPDGTDIQWTKGIAQQIPSALMKD